MKKEGFVCRFLLPCFSYPTGTTTTTTTNRITEYSTGHNTAITDVTTTTTTTTKRSTTTTSGRTNNRQEPNLSTHQRYIDHPYQNKNYYYDNEEDYEDESASSMGDEIGALEYYPNNYSNNDCNWKYNFKPTEQLPAQPPPRETEAPGPLKTVVTGTFYGHRQGHICFCIQKDRHNYSKPPLLLELSIPTDDLVKEMQRELVRIVLECDSSSNKSSCRLLTIPIWTMYINGRKVGFAARRKPTDKDRRILKTIQSTTVGAGVIPKELTTMASPRPHPYQGRGGGHPYQGGEGGRSHPYQGGEGGHLYQGGGGGRSHPYQGGEEGRPYQGEEGGGGRGRGGGEEEAGGGGGGVGVGIGIGIGVGVGVGVGNGDELIFMRANYRRVVGSFDTESFHLTNPDGCLSSQELSVFLMRSR